MMSLLLMLCVVTVGAAAFESSDRAQAAYSSIDAAVAEQFGRNSTTGLANFPAGFGGVWLDEENYLIIGLTESALTEKDYYSELSGDPEVIRFTRVNYDLDTLLDIQAEISQTYPELKDVEFYLEGALIDLPSNTVQLTVMQGGLEKALAYYTGLYGDAISGVEGQEAIEGTVGGETTQGLVISIWIVIAALAALLAFIALVVIFTVLLIQRGRRKKRQKKAEMEQAAARAAQAARSKKK